jgi:P-type conjugative transfer protein TrbJ
MRRLKHGIVCFVLLLLCQFAVPPKAQAQVAVEDFLNWVENALQVIQQAYEIYQKYMQLYNDYQRYATMLKNLEHYDSLTFENLVSLANAVNDIMQYGYSLGHTLYDIDEQFAETFPGYEPILQSDWLSTFEYRNRRTLDTLRYTLGALNRIADDSVEAQEILGDIAGDAEAADGNLEALQAANEFLHQQGSQLGKISQQLSVQTNAQAVFWAYQVDREASDRATTSEWITNGVGEVPPYDGAAGAHGVPVDWPWPCLNCGSRAAVGGGR